MFQILKSLFLVAKPCSVPTLRTISVTVPQMKKMKFSDLQPDSDVILISGKDDEKTVMKYSEVLEKVKQILTLFVN